jgi:hypothetical protein
MRGAGIVDQETCTRDLAIYDAAQLLRSRADPDAPEQLTDHLVDLVRSGRFRLLDSS